MNEGCERLHSRFSVRRQSFTVTLHDYPSTYATGQRAANAGCAVNRRFSAQDVVLPFYFFVDNSPALWDIPVKPARLFRAEGAARRRRRDGNSPIIW